MPEWITYNFLPLIICLLSYLSGSISSAILTCHIMKLEDLRKLGSGNPGASNMLRNHGKLPAAITFAGDIIKVIIPIGIALRLDLSPYWLSWIACAGCIGHMYPIYHRFEGGKGVATAYGATYMMCWPAGLVLSGIWLTLAKLSGTASVGSITAWLCAPIIILFWQPEMWSGITCISLLIVFRHRENIKRLIKKEEHSLKSTNPPSSN